VDTGYEQEIVKLKNSLFVLGLQSFIEAIPSRGSWRANSNYVAQNVLSALLQYPDRDVLRVDADAVFQRYPDLFLTEGFDADVAAHVHDFRWHHQELLGGTLFFKNTLEVRRLVNDWVDWCLVSRPSERPGDLLQELLRCEIAPDYHKYRVKFAELPDTYCKIFDIMRDVRDPVIEHFQASRRFRKQVDRKGKR
jgi:hypothetical protein